MLAPNSGSPNAPSDLLLKIAELARVRAEHRDFYFDELRKHLQASHDLSEVGKGVQAAGLQTAAADLYQRLSSLTDGERRAIEGILEGKNTFQRISGGGLSSLVETTRQIAVLFSLLTGKPEPQSSSSRKRGRKLGQIKNTAHQEFVWALLISTRTAGGKLTVEKTGRFGTLIDAIQMLMPHLPEGFAQHPLSATTLQRIATKCDRTFRQLNAIDT